MVLSAVLVSLGLATGALAQFGLTQDSTSFTINTGSTNSLVAKVSKSNCDITSIVFRGQQLQGPQAIGTHIGSGLGSATVTAEVIDGKRC